MTCLLVAFQQAGAWHDQNGQGSRVSQRNWNTEAGTGTYASTTTRANGKTNSRQGAITKTGEGIYTVDGTRTGASGKVADVDKTIVFF
jgi:hypothetical protein